MKRRFGRMGRVVVLLVAVAILFFYPLLAPPAHRIDQAHCDMLKKGMTESEVEGIFGVPAGEYDWAAAAPFIWSDVSYFTVGQTWSVTPKQTFFFESDGASMISGSWLSISGEIKSWTGRHGSFHVVFDRQGRVSSTGWASETRIDPPWKRWWRQWRGK